MIDKRVRRRLVRRPQAERVSTAERTETRALSRHATEWRHEHEMRVRAEVPSGACRFGRPPHDAVSVGAGVDPRGQRVISEYVAGDGRFALAEPFDNGFDRVRPGAEEHILVIRDRRVHARPVAHFEENYREAPFPQRGAGA